MSIETTYSFVVLAFAVAAIWLAWIAMKRGLTYTAMVAIVWVLSLLAVARLWHTLRELVDPGSIFGISGEYLEYTIYLGAYVVFIALMCKALRIKQ